LIGLGASDSLLRDLAGNSFSGCAIRAVLLALFHNLPFDMGSLDGDIGDIAIADGMAMYFLEAATGSATTCVQCSNGCIPRHLCVVDQHVASVVAANVGGWPSAPQCSFASSSSKSKIVKTIFQA